MNIVPLLLVLCLIFIITKFMPRDSRTLDLTLIEAMKPTGERHCKALQEWNYVIMGGHSSIIYPIVCERERKC